MVHNSKALLQTLSTLITESVTDCKSGFELSPVKADGTVFVRFRSTDTASANELAYRFIEVLSLKRAQYTQTDDHKFRLPLTQFGSLS